MVNFGVVIRVDTNFFSSEVEGESAVLHRLQFMMGLEVWKAPQAAVNDVRETLLLGYLKQKQDKKKMVINFGKYITDNLFLLPKT